MTTLSNANNPPVIKPAQAKAQRAQVRESSLLLSLAERGWLPDVVIRMGIRRLLGRRLAECDAGGPEARSRRNDQLLAYARSGPIAIETDAANDQHYELPPAFFQRVLGARLKYSGCYWPDGATSLDAAECAALAQVAQRAEVADGQSILELGCGWGSLTLWMAEHYPNARITAVSNSTPQRRFIEDCARQRGLRNVNVITCDINTFDPGDTFDRVVSIEMFEHMRNLGDLTGRIHDWLTPGGKLFVHVFCHRRSAYRFDVHGRDNWMGRHFFTGGMMPAADTLPRVVSDGLELEQQWAVDGTHYQKTAEAWLANLDAQRRDMRQVMAETYPPKLADIWLQRWRMFFMACAELWGYRGGEEWHIAHYRWARPEQSQ